MSLEVSVRELQVSDWYWQYECQVQGCRRAIDRSVSRFQGCHNQSKRGARCHSAQPCFTLCPFTGIHFLGATGSAA